MATNWLFGIQQEVARNTILTVNYVANNVHHMQSGVDFAALNANPANVFTQARQFSGFANENILADGLGSNYNSLQVKLTRRAGRLNLEANYTWSHEIDDMLNVFSPGFESPYTPIFDHGSGDWDVRHNLTGSAVYSLPDLKGSNSFVQKALGGWQTSGILQTRSGLPTNITLVSGFFGNPVRPDYVTGQPLWVPNHSWPGSSYNINAFAIEPTYDGTPGGTIGTVGRNSLRGPAYFQLDLSGMKNFAITERVTMQFRADIFNIFNHPNFTNPDGGICICQSIGTFRQVLPAESSTPISVASAKPSPMRMEHRSEAALRAKPNSHSGSPSNHSTPAYHGSNNRPLLPYLQAEPASEGKCRSRTSRITISIPWSACLTRGMAAKWDGTRSADV